MLVLINLLCQVWKYFACFGIKSHSHFILFPTLSIVNRPCSATFSICDGSVDFTDKQMLFPHLAHLHLPRNISLVNSSHFLFSNPNSLSATDFTSLTMSIWADSVDIYRQTNTISIHSKINIFIN